LTQTYEAPKFLLEEDRDKNVVFFPVVIFLNRKAKCGARKIGGMELGMHDW